MALRILLVDDSMAARFFLRKCLPSDEALEIREASNGAEAVDQFAAFRPHLTFLDLTMPVMDGFEALARIRKLDREAVVIVLSADVQTQTQERVAALGASDFLKKPPRREAIALAMKLARGEDDA